MGRRLLIGIFLLFSSVQSFYLPGVAPRDYEDGSRVELYVNKLDSSETQLPFEYYYLNYCEPNQLEQKGENLGQILKGDRIETSPYVVNMNIEDTCKPLCVKENKKTQIENFKWMIDNQYRASWVMDNLPSGLRKSVSQLHRSGRLSYYQDGFPIGYKKDGTYYINNHAHIVIKIYNTYRSQDKPSSWRVVGFLVEPLSIKYLQDMQPACNDSNFVTFLARSKTLTEVVMRADEEVDYPMDFEVENLPPQPLEGKIAYSYSVQFEESDLKWASRWDMYLYMEGDSDEVHWLSIINSFAMVLFLSGMVAHILGRTLRRDINYYNERADMEAGDETGWKQVHGDVFRAPVYSGIFAIVIGSGVQIISMTLLTLFFACLGFLSPAHRGGLLTTMLLLYVFMGVFGGYTSARFYKMFGGNNWKRNALGTAFIVPGSIFSIFFVINLFIWSEESSGAVPFSTLLSLLVLWFGISVPLTFLGSAVGFRKQKIDNPCKVNRIPKPLNIIPGSFKIKFICLMAGSLPFGCMFIELSYVMKSMWHHTLFYYFFGFLFLCFLVLMVTSAEVSILMSYILLCREDYRWWWLSFAVAGSSGVYLFLYSVLYFLVELSLTRFSSVVLYLGYMLVMSIGYSLITGTIGFLATFYFIRLIYSLIKVE